jgi:hypothetical protein
MVGECLSSPILPINLRLSSFNNPSLDQRRAHKSIFMPNKFVSSRSSLFYFTHFLYVSMINHVCVHSLFFLIGGEDIYTKYHTRVQREKKGERERARNSREWEGLINSVCSRRWRCWMTFPHVDSIYRQAQEWDVDWHLSPIRYVKKITQVICRRHTSVDDDEIYICRDDVLLLRNEHMCTGLFPIQSDPLQG